MFVIDFIGHEFKKTLKDKTLVPDVWVSHGAHVSDTQLLKNPVTGGWRLVLHVRWTPGSRRDRAQNQKPAIEFRLFSRTRPWP